MSRQIKIHKVGSESNPMHKSRALNRGAVILTPMRFNPERLMEGHLTVGLGHRITRYHFFLKSKGYYKVKKPLPLFVNTQ